MKVIRGLTGARLALTSIIALGAAASLTVLMLPMEGGEGYAVIYCWSASGVSRAAVVGGTIYYDFVHSANKAREIDVIRIVDGDPVLVAIYFREYGAGVPASPAEVGGSGWYETGDFIVYEAWRRLPGSFEVSTREWAYVRLGGGGFWVTGEECDKIGLKTVTSGEP